MVEFRAECPVWNDTTDLYAKEQRDGKVYALVASGIELREVSSGEIWPKFLSFPLKDDAAQSLFTALWNAGYRPRNGETGTAQVEALKAHLQDMRRLALRGVPTVRGEG